MSLFSLLKTEQVHPSMRWGRRKQKQVAKTEIDSIKKKTEAELEKKRFFSFSWLSKLIPKSNSSSPKCPSCKPKHVANIPSPITNPVQNTKQQTPPRTSSHMSPLAPHRRSVGDSDRPRTLPPRQRRHHSCGGESNLATSSVTLGNVIPFSFMANDKENSSLVPVPVPDPTLFRHKMRRRLKNRPIITAVDDDDDNTHRKSFSRRIKARKCRVRVYSPRQGPKDKLETMAKKFAVVKRSSEPERDFRESMVEMIREKGIGRSEELESLLACYLTLNSDEHHDVIVRVFRQLWYQINPERFVIGN